MTREVYLMNVYPKNSKILYDIYGVDIFDVELKQGWRHLTTKYFKWTLPVK